MAPRLRLQTLPEVAPIQGPTPQYHLDASGAFGEQLVQQVGRLEGAAVSEGQKRLEEQRGRADVAAIEEAEARFQLDVNDRMYGKDGKGFLSLEGHDALKASTTTFDEIQKRRAEIEGTLTDRQRTAFRARTNGTLVATQRQLEGHVAQQVKVVEGQAFASRRAAALDTVANGYLDAGTIDRERQNLEPLVMAEAKRRGLEGAGTYPPPADSAAGQVLHEWRNDVAKTVLERLLADKDATRAKAFLAQPSAPGGASVREALGQEGAKYEAAIAHVSEQVESFDRAASAVEAARNPSTGKVDERSARKTVADAPPALRATTRAHLEQLLNGESESWRATVGDWWNQAKTAYEGGPDGKARRGLQAIPGNVSSWLRANAPDAWRSMQDWAKADIEHARSGASTPDQEAAFTELMVKAIDNPDQFVTLTGPEIEQKHLSRVSPKERRALLGTILQAKAQAHRPDETLPANVVKEILSKGRPGGGGASLFPAKGDDPGQWPPEKSQLFNVIFRDLLAYQAQEKARTGKVPELDAFSKRIDGWMQRGTVKDTGVFFDDKGVPRVKALTSPAYQGKDFEVDSPPAAPVPNPKRAEFRALLRGDRKAAVPETEAVLQYLWAIDPTNPKGNPQAQPPAEFFQTYDLDELDLRAAGGRAGEASVPYNRVP